MKIIRILVLPLLLTMHGLASGGINTGHTAYKQGDYDTALREWRPLAEQGNAGAQLNLGFMYDNGFGVSQNYNEAIKWYRKAAEQGNDRAQYNLGLMYDSGDGVQQDYVQAYMWYNIVAVDSGDGEAIAISYRDYVAREMTPDQVARAEKLSREWRGKHP